MHWRTIDFTMLFILSCFTIGVVQRYENYFEENDSDCKNSSMIIFLVKGIRFNISIQTIIFYTYDNYVNFQCKECKFPPRYILLKCNGIMIIHTDFLRRELSEVKTCTLTINITN